MKKHYYIYVTKDCNLKCDYCSGIDINKNRTVCRTKPADVKAIADFIIKDSYDEDLHICNANIYFYGGEPLLNQNTIKEIISLTRDKGLTYISYTNGTMIQKIDKQLLNDLNYLFVSIDGTKESHDKHRGRGTFDQIMQTYSRMRPEFKGKTLARITITPDNHLFHAVTQVAEKFDYVYWQLQHNTNTKDIPEFQKRYLSELNKLLDYWMRKIAEGKVLNLIPFQIVAGNILFNNEQEYFQCGCGSSLIIIDLDGTCYLCDEMMSHEYRMGDIRNGVTFPGFKNGQLSRKCRDCEIRSICGGRCARMHLMFPEEAIDFYCNCTKSLYDGILKRIPEIERLISLNVLRKEDVPDKMDFVENIP